MNVFTELLQITTQVSSIEILQGINASLNIAAVVAVLVVRSEVKGLRETVEILQSFILNNSQLKGSGK